MYTYVVYRVHYCSALNHTKHAQSVKHKQNHVHIISFFPFFLWIFFCRSFMHSLSWFSNSQKRRKKEIGAHTMVIAFIHHSWCSLCCDSNIYAYCTHSNKSIQIFHSIELYDAKNNSHNTTKYNTARAYHGNNFLLTLHSTAIAVATAVAIEHWCCWTSLLHSTAITLEISCHKRIERHGVASVKHINHEICKKAKKKNYTYIFIYSY